jgi:hypothetical protein
MKLNRINPIVVAIVGVILCLMSGVGIYILLIQASQNRITAAEGRISAAGDVSDAAVASAKQSLAEAKVQVASANLGWRKRQDSLMPPYDVSNRFRAWKQISYELEAYLGPDIERWVPRTGVTLLSAVTIAAPPSNPNAVTNAPLVIPIGGGNMSVGGSFRGILAHILRWNNFNRLVLINNLQLAGTSPYMEGTYAASVIIFPQNEDKIGAVIPQAGGATTATFGGPGGGAGAFGGGPGGPGGPPPGAGSSRSGA